MPFLTDIVNPPNQLQFKDLIKTLEAEKLKSGFCNEIGRLSQGYEDAKGTNAVYFIPKSEVPKGKHVAYYRLVCSILPQKTETHRVQITAGGNLMNYYGTTINPYSGLTTIKPYWNSIISTNNSKYFTTEI